ncbi:MAG: hypothetical protein QXL06_06550, partial [Nitrososphaerota archaeon]
MTSPKIRRRGISAIIGTAIALSIVFIVLVPLFLYMQSLQSIFMQEASRRLQYELERLNERLEVYISMSKDLDSYGRRQLYLIAHNPGVLSVEVPAIYLESKVEGLKKMELPIEGGGGEGYLTISPGQKLTKRLEFYFKPNIDDEVRVKIISRRGNNFASENSIGPVRLPYMLIVTVENMFIGYKYKVEVEVSDRDRYGNVNEYGCVLSALQERSASGCNTLDEYVIVPQTPSGGAGVAFFMVAPGSYIVRLKVESPEGSESVFGSYGPFDVIDDTNIRIVGPTLPTPLKIPLRVQTSYTNVISILERNGMSITIPYIISLGNQSEPLRRIKISIGADCIGCIIDEQSVWEITLTRMHPGESYVNHVELVVT